MDFLGILGILFVVAVIVGLAKASNDEERKTTIETELATNYPGTKIFVSKYDFSYVAVDFKTSHIMLGLKEQRGGFTNLEMPYDCVYDFSEVAEVAVVKDEATVSSTNRGSQAVGAAVGAVAFGGLGAVVGGLSGSSTAHDRVRRITLRIKVDDPDQPVHDVTMFWRADKKGVKSDGSLITRDLKDTEEFSTHVSNAIRRAAATSGAVISKAAPQQSTADRIRDLWQLRQEGILSDEEFQTEKTKALNGVVEAMPSTA